MANSNSTKVNSSAPNTGLKRNQVFLSYASEDYKKVQKICEGLKKRGLDVWFDKDKKKPGKWKKRIEKAIAKSRYFVFCISETSLNKTTSTQSSFVDNELQIAWEFSRDLDEGLFTIVPVRIEECERGDLRLSGWEQYDLFKDFETELDKLSIDLGGISLSDSETKDNRSKERKLFESLLGKIFLAFLNRKYSTALILAETLNEIVPNNVDALNSKGVSLFLLGRFKESIAVFSEITNLFPNSPDSWFNLGTTFLLGGKNYTEAIESFEKALLLDKNDHQAWNNKAISHFNLKQFDAAFKSYEASLKINPENYLAWIGKGNSLFFMDGSKEIECKLIIQEFDQALHYDPTRHEAWHCKGITYIKYQKIPEAIKCLKKALEIVGNKFGKNNPLYLGIFQDINILETAKK